MRLHHLEITAFGPFAGTVAVDFDQLGATGLFLLTGPTGAGKTSVLDAVCFALYGEVPGDRQQARHLRSDHAAEGVAPEVVLTTSIAGRTFRFTRSPACERPKRRGAGTTRQQPRVLVEEQVGEAWTGLATRLDDAGLLVTSLLGMTCAQFTQVALLPQGRFQAFLRASSGERHDVLQRLFRTDRFERVEHWLAEHRTDLRRRSETLGLRVAGTVHRLQEAGAAVVPDTWDLDDLSAPAAGGEVAAWAEAVATAAADAHAAALRRHRSAAAVARDAEAAHASAARAAALLDEAATARATLAVLEADAEDAEHTAHTLAAHRRAMTVEPLARAARAADAAALAGVAAARRALDEAGLTDSGEQTAAAEVEDALERTEATRTALRSALPRVAELTRRRADLETVRRTLETDATAWADVRRAVADLPDRVRQAERDQRAAMAAAADAAPATEAISRARAGLDAAQELLRLSQHVEDGRATLLTATETAQQLRDAYLDAREARIASVASELAVDLVSGCSCPVCGSVEHPAPARNAGLGTREAEDAARRAYEDAESARMALHEAQAAQSARLQAVREATAGRSLEAWSVDCEEAEARLSAAEAAAADALRLGGEHETLARRLEETAATAAVLEVAVARAEERVHTLESSVEALEGELADVLVDDTEGAAAADLEALLAEVEGRVQLMRSARTCVERLALLRAAAESAGARAQHACAAAGFADPDSALAALLDVDEARAITAALDARAARFATAQATLTRADVCAALAGEPPDLDALAESALEAGTTRDAATALLLDAERSRDRTRGLAADIDAGLASWLPVREAASVAAALASFAEGKGADNPLRMRLSAYVLAERLRQVVEAANARLGSMSGQRYTLEQADERGAGDRRGGLSLRVRDEWSGALRDPVTLSGGETFVVSLALALGLADTVSHEAGGTDIDTLFIDEGFGSLDAETLEEVMDTLDTLREGGRTVGLVSHVPELRERITSRLEVHKTRSGSTLVAP